MATPVISRVAETKSFGEPRIIFRRIKGRIVPIVNKERVGKDFTIAGKAGLIAGSGLALGTVGIRRFRGTKTHVNLVRKTTLSRLAASERAARSQRKIRKFTRVAKRFSRKKGIFDFSGLGGKAKKVAKVKNVKKSGVILRGARAASKFALRNPIALAAGLVTTGVAAGHLGFELKAQSRFGARL